MNVYILTKEPFPYGMAAVSRIKCFVKAIMSEGFTCKVIVYSRTHINSELPNKGRIEGISYEYIGKSSKRMKGSLMGRLQSFLLQYHLLFYLLLKLKKGDIVIGEHRSNCKWQRLVLSVIHYCKAFYISELCELPFCTSKETSQMIKKREYAYKYLFPRYDGVIAISDALVDLASKHCNSRCVIRKIPILVDFDEYNLPNKLSLAEYPYIFHSGTLSEQKDGILGMIEAFGIANKKLKNKIHFVFTGDIGKSPHSHEIRFLIEKYNLYKVIHFVGYLSNEELRDKLSKAALVVINKNVTQQNIYCFSTKLAEYMAAGKPIIITNVGEALNWLKDKYDCLVVEPNDISQLSEMIVEIFSNYSMYGILGYNARVSCREYFDCKKYGRTFKKIFVKFMHHERSI